MMNTINQSESNRLRKLALKNLELAHAIDGLKPVIVMHQHESGASGYIYWSSKADITTDDAVSVLEAKFEEERGESLLIETSVTLDELVGMHANQPDSAVSFYGQHAATVFMQELLDSVETVSSIVDEHGARTLADLMYLQHAILTGGFIDYYPDESKALEIASALPSGKQWSKFIKVEYLLAAV